jgi:large subunit ribosomal protein L15
MAKFLSEMKPPHGAVKKKKRLGRGDASGHGGTSTKGHKGQKARAGGYHKVAFEGGQMPLYRRLPKRGFHNPFRKKYAVVNLSDLEGIPAGTKVDSAYLKAQRKIRALHDGLKILGDGELKVALTIIAETFSKSAQEKIEKAGGKAEIKGNK